MKLNVKQQILRYVTGRIVREIAEARGHFAVGQQLHAVHVIYVGLIGKKRLIAAGLGLITAAAVYFDNFTAAVWCGSATGIGAAASAQVGMIGPLWGEKDEAKRIDGWKAVDKYIAENALVIPLLQYVQPILHAPGVVVTPHASGALLPHLMKRA